MDDYNKGRNGLSYGPGVPTRDWYRGDEERRALEQQQARQREDERRRNEEASRRQQQQFHRDAMDRQLASDSPNKLTSGYRSSGATASPVVWLFGIMGAVMGAGYSVSQGSVWFVGAFFGFVTGGFLSGLFSLFKIGRIILALIGLAFAAGIAYEMFLRPDKAAQEIPDNSSVNAASFKVSQCESAIRLSKTTGANIDNATAQCNQIKESFKSSFNSLSVTSQEQFCKEYNRNLNNKTKFVSNTCKTKGF